MLCKRIANSWRGCQLHQRGMASALSDALTVDDEPGALGDLVIELHGGAVGLMRKPVDASRARLRGSLVDSLDQLSSNAVAARLFHGEEVLQISMSELSKSWSDEKDSEPGRLTFLHAPQRWRERARKHRRSAPKSFS